MRNKTLIALFVFSGVTANVSANEVFFELPNDGNWYQLQAADDFEEICSSSTPDSCVINVGESYWLINHSVPSTSSDHRRLIVGQQNTDSGDSINNNPMGQLTRVENSCTLTQGATVAGRASSCTVSCPSGGTVVGVLECSAQYSVGNFNDQFPTSFTSSESNASCFVAFDDARDWDLSPFASDSATIRVAAMCVMP